MWWNVFLSGEILFAVSGYISQITLTQFLIPVVNVTKAV